MSPARGLPTDDRGREKRDWPFTAIRLPSGNTVIASYHATGNRVKLCEVTREKQVVWRSSGMDAGFHHFQILSTNGEPVAEATWK